MANKKRERKAKGGKEKGRYKELKNLSSHVQKVSRKCLIDEEQLRIEKQPFGKTDTITTVEIMRTLKKVIIAGFV